MTKQAKIAVKKARVWRTIPEGDIETISDGFLFLNTGKFIGKFTDIKLSGGLNQSIAGGKLRYFKSYEVDAIIAGLDKFYSQFSSVLKLAKDDISDAYTARLSDEAIIEIRNSTESISELAAHHNVAFSTISRIKNNTTYKNVGVEGLNKGQ